MINRQNWLDVKAFLAYQHGTIQNDDATTKRQRIALRHLLEWADEKPFDKAKTIEPSFPVYLSSKRDENGQTFANSGGEKNLQITRQFFTFARSEFSSRYKNISLSWIKTIIPSKRNSAQSRLRDHKHYTLESVLKIASIPAQTLETKRDIAAVAFLFLSGLRIGAFTSLPIECVNIAENEVLQLPEKGVRTKNRKAAITYLLQIPELKALVIEWDSIIKAQLSPHDLWYPVLERGRDAFVKGARAHEARGVDFTRRLKILCEMAGVPFMSPHKLRHGHVVYSLKNANDLQDLKAISQNVMHSSIQITDSIYGNLSGMDVKRAMSAIGSASDVAANPTPGAPLDLSAFLSLLSNPEIQAVISKVTNGQKPTKTKTKKGK